MALSSENSESLKFPSIPKDLLKQIMVNNEKSLIIYKYKASFWKLTLNIPVLAKKWKWI